MKFFSLLFLLIACLILNRSCSGQQKNIQKGIVNSNASELNNAAMNIYAEFSSNKDSLLIAINLLDHAILKDSLFSQAYSNKSILLCNMGNYSEAINSLNKILFIAPTLTDLKSLKGFILEKSGDSLRAIETYKDALYDYDRRLKTDSNNISLMLNRAFLYFFIENYNRGISEFKKISQHYPYDISVKKMNDIFMSFDRKSFIDSICSE